MKNWIIAIDGPASSGKSTTAKLLAQRLAYAYIDTGAMYRCCALFAMRRGLDVSDIGQIEPIMGEIDIRICFSEHGNSICLNGEDVSEAIRGKEISKLASDISALACVRTRMVELQRQMGIRGAVVLDGRDIGTVVFPEAEIKFFMTAKPEVRAQRRWQELLAKGISCTFAEVLAELLQRDQNDSSRSLAPLIAAEDAILIDTTDLDIDQQVELMYAMVQKGMSQS